MAIEYTTLVPIAVSVGTLALSYYMTRHKVSYDYIGSLEKRVQYLEQANKDLENELKDVRKENVMLLRQLVSEAVKPNVTVNTQKEVG